MNYRFFSLIAICCSSFAFDVSAQNEVEFNYLLDDIEEYRKEKEVIVSSLNEDERIKSRQEREARALKRINERLKRAGLDDIESIDDLPEEFEPLDAFLIEAASITLDYARLY